MKDVLDLFTTILLLVFAGTGFAIWMRWGYVGVEMIYRERKELDKRMQQDVRESVVERP